MSSMTGKGAADIKGATGIAMAGIATAYAIVTAVAGLMEDVGSRPSIAGHKCTYRSLLFTPVLTRNDSAFRVCVRHDVL